MSLLDVLEWLQYSSPLVAMRASPWFFPVIASIHLMGLALISGALLVVDLRLLGFGVRFVPVAQLAREAERWLLISLFILLSTGILQFLCFAATKYYYLRAFWVKMAVLAAAIVYTFTVRRKVLMSPNPPASPRMGKLVALVSLCLWFTVAVAGRLIGFP